MPRLRLFLLDMDSSVKGVYLGKPWPLTVFLPSHSLLCSSPFVPSHINWCQSLRPTHPLIVLLLALHRFYEIRTQLTLVYLHICHHSSRSPIYSFSYTVLENSSYSSPWFTFSFYILGSPFALKLVSPSVQPSQIKMRYHWRCPKEKLVGEFYAVEAYDASKV